MNKMIDGGARLNVPLDYQTTVVWHSVLIANDEFNSKCCKLNLASSYFSNQCVYLVCAIT